MEPVWLEKKAVLAIHNKLAAEFGGSAGIRDHSLLKSALERPINKFLYDESSLHLLAASYAYGFIKNHPFIDGNKRIGLVAMELFLALNGVTLEATQVEKYTLIIGVAEGSVTEEEIAVWIKAHAPHS